MPTLCGHNVIELTCLLQRRSHKGFALSIRYESHATPTDLRRSQNPVPARAGGFKSNLRSSNWLLVYPMAMTAARAARKCNADDETLPETLAIATSSHSIARPKKNGLPRPSSRYRLERPNLPPIKPIELAGTHLFPLSRASNLATKVDSDVPWAWQKARSCTRSRLRSRRSHLLT
jgi:hypothetical protein